MPLMRSWVESANVPDGNVPLNNLPSGAFRAKANAEVFGCCVAIGDKVLDLSGMEEDGLLDATEGRDLFLFADLAEFMAAGPEVWAAVRGELQERLAEGATDQEPVAAHLMAMAEVELLLPFTVAEYTDFYAGRNHAFNVGSMFRGPENALPPNWLHIPIGYNGRASSVVVSGTDIRRPWGQLKSPQHETPIFAPSRRFDIELEMGAVVGTPSPYGQPVTVQEADDMIFGYVLLNDWSARDIQAWEYQPLGPFQAKATATSISPWVVPKAALEPFRCSTPEREVPLLPHLEEPGPMLYDIALEIDMAPAGGAAKTLARTNYREMYYSAAQQLAHHTTAGSGMNAGDLLGSGTISGPEKENRGSLLEISWGGKEPFELADGSERSFIEDGDTLTLRGWCAGDGYRVGFGECVGTVVPALEDPYKR